MRPGEGRGRGEAPPPLRPPPPLWAHRSAWRARARSLRALGGRGGAYVIHGRPPQPPGRGAVAAQAPADGLTDRQGTEGRADGQAMPGEAARAELLLPEAGGPGPRTGETRALSRLRVSPPPSLSLSLSPLYPSFSVPIPSLSQSHFAPPPRLRPFSLRRSPSLSLFAPLPSSSPLRPLPWSPALRAPES